MGARYPFYLLADSRAGQIKEGEVTRTAPSGQPVQGNIRHGFVYERVPHVTLICTMHLAKGLEFRAVVVMACDEDVIPNAERIKALTDDSNLEEVVATERHLLYVACTRARDHLLITSGDTCSEFVEDLLG